MNTTQNPKHNVDNDSVMIQKANIIDLKLYEIHLTTK